MALDVQHDPDQKKFIVYSDDGADSYLKYEKRKGNTLDYVSTYVPVSQRGQGIASGIVKEALDYAKQNDFYVIPSCPFVSDYIDRHPEYADLKPS
jgi:predicted GNAT family acetyltransferase